MTGTDTATRVPTELLKKYDYPGPRYTSYPTVPVWSDEVSAKHYFGALSAAGTRADQPLSLYLHIPFCERRCFYCGCNTCIINNRDGVLRYLETLTTEMDAVCRHLDKRRTISQLHFGGGTPTYLTIDEMALLLDRIEERFSFLERVERSIEVDPRVTTGEQIDFLARRGFNRLSLGVQDLDPQVQGAIGRVQPVEMVQQMMEHGRRVGFDGINFDLIYGLPLQTATSFAATLDRVIEMRPDRLAVYSFAYLPQAKAHQARIEPDDLPPTEEKYRLFATAIEKLTAAGYRQIGMDHFALPDDELSRAQVDGRLHRNFMGYTVQSADEMIGLGMSSIGYVDNAFFQNVSRLGAYNDAVESDGVAVFRGMQLSDDDLLRRHLITQLMCNFRLDKNDLKKHFSVDYDSTFAEEDPKLQRFIDDGFLERTADGLAVTPVGRTFVRNIAMIFDSYLKSDKQKTRATFSRTI